MAVLSVGIDPRGARQGADEFVRSMSDIKRSSADALGGIEGATSKASSSILSLAKGVAGAVGVMVSFGAAISFAKDSIMLAARVETLGIVMRQTANNAGLTGKEVMAVAAAVKKMGITTEEAYGNVTKMIQAQLDLTQATKLARVAQDAAVIAGVNSSQAFEGMIHGVVTLQPEMLRMYGIILNMNEVFEKYRLANNILSRELSGTQKQQAFLSATIEAGRNIMGSYEAAMRTAGKQLTSMPRYIDEVKERFGTLFLPAFNKVLFDMVDALKMTSAQLDGMGDGGNLQKIQTALLTTVDAIGHLVKAAVQMAGAWLAFSAMQTVVVWLQRMQVQMALLRMETAAGATMWSVWRAQAQASGAAAQIAAGQITVLGVAMNLAFAGIAGWQFGTFLRENFQSVENAGIRFVSITMKGLEYLAFGFKSLADIISGVLMKPFDLIVSGFRTVVDTIARMIDAMPEGLKDRLGIGTLADDMRKFSAGLKNAWPEVDIGASLKWNKDTLEKNLSGINTTISEMIGEVDLKFNPKSVDAAGDALKMKMGQTSIEITKMVDEIEKKTASLKLEGLGPAQRIRAEADKTIEEKIVPFEKQIEEFRKKGQNVTEMEKQVAAARKTIAAQTGMQLANLNKEWADKIALQQVEHSKTMLDLQADLGQKQLSLANAKNLDTIKGSDVAESLRNEQEKIEDANDKLKSLTADRVVIGEKLRQALKKGEAPEIDRLQKELSALDLRAKITAIDIDRAAIDRAKANLEKNLQAGETLREMGLSHTESMASEGASGKAKLVELDMTSRKITSIQRDMMAYRINYEALDDTLARYQDQLTEILLIEEQLNGPPSNANIIKKEELLNKISLTQERLNNLSLEGAIILRRAYDTTPIGKMQMALDGLATAAYDFGSSVSQTVTSAFKGMEDALVAFVMTGKTSFKQLANSIIADMARIAIQQAIMKPITAGLSTLLEGFLGPAAPIAAAAVTGGGGSFSGSFADSSWANFKASAKGTAFDQHSNVIPFRKGGVVSEPTMFRFSRGTGIMAEAGIPEAIMPLARLPGGDLGVRSAGSAEQKGNMNVRVEIINQGGEKMQVTDTKVRFDPQEMVVTLWMDALKRNRFGLRDAVGG